MPPYRHTQVSWLLLSTLAAIVIVLLAIGAAPAIVAIGAMAIILLPLFGTLTVHVDEHELAFWFGVGAIRRRHSLASIRAWAPVRNPWYYGWGIRMYPGGMLYNASGLDAVEIVLADGTQFRLGTDEPERLVAALRQRLGEPQPLSPFERETVMRRRGRWGWAIAVVVAGSVVFAAAGILIHLREPSVTLEAGTFSVRGGVYRVSLPVSDIAAVSLDAALPAIRTRTNGFALGRTLRGHFRLLGGERAQLFVDSGQPPFVHVRAGEQIVFVNFDDPARTRTLYDDLVAAGAPAAPAETP